MNLIKWIARSFENDAKALFAIGLMLLFLFSVFVQASVDINENNRESEQAIESTIEQKRGGGFSANVTEVSVKESAGALPELTCRSLTDEDCTTLKRIAMAEAEGESTEGKALVMMVVLNRVDDDWFPDTVSEVVFQKLSGKYQFTPVKDGGRYWTVEPNDDCEAALDLIVSGWDESQGALYFCSSNVETWHDKNLEYLFKVGGHKFYK